MKEAMEDSWSQVHLGLSTVRLITAMPDGVGLGLSTSYPYLLCCLRKHSAGQEKSWQSRTLKLTLRSIHADTICSYSQLARTMTAAAVWWVLVKRRGHSTFLA